MKISVNGISFDDVKFTTADSSLSQLLAIMSRALEENSVRQFSLGVSVEENSWAKAVATLGFSDMDNFSTETFSLHTTGESAVVAVQQFLCLCKEAQDFHSTRRDSQGIKIPCVFTVRDQKGNIIGTIT